MHSSFIQHAAIATIPVLPSPVVSFLVVLRSKSVVGSARVDVCSALPAALLPNILLAVWELLTGLIAFKGLHYGAIIEHVALMGVRPPIPDGAAEDYVLLMCSCWHPDPQQRPTFEQVGPCGTGCRYSSKCLEGFGSRPSGKGRGRSMLWRWSVSMTSSTASSTVVTECMVCFDVPLHDGAPP